MAGSVRGIKLLVIIYEFKSYQWNGFFLRPPIKYPAGIIMQVKLSLGTGTSGVPITRRGSLFRHNTQSKTYARFFEQK
jgi:hypothetical protein